jgi:hypothetical protein
MAFPKASGYSNLPNGNFSPIIFSRKTQLALRKASVVEAVTNTDYSGEISNFGDSIRIVKEPTVQVTTYARGTTLATQDLSDDDFTMVIDQANYFQFALDDIEESHQHVSFGDLASDHAGYKLRDTMDAEVTSIPLAADGGAGGITSPLTIMNRMARLMDEANVDTDGRWLVCDPVFAEVLMDSSSKLINSDFGGGDEMRNGRLPGTIRGFSIYKSNNLPYAGTGPGTTAAAGSEANFGVMVAGHASAVSTAQQIAKTETFRSPNTFADVYRGLNLYGRKILRPETLFTANYNLA